MLMPEKHIRITESLFGIGGIIVECLDDKSVLLDEIILYVEEYFNKNNKEKIYNNIDNIILAIDFLYSIGIVEIDIDGRIYNVFNRA